jgi:hypothetical protein
MTLKGEMKLPLNYKHRTITANVGREEKLQRIAHHDTR